MVKWRSVKVPTRWAVAVLVGVVAMIGGCSPSAGQTTPTAPPPSPMDVTGGVVTLEQGRVSTACFSYETDASIPYELSPYAEGCGADIGMRGGDALTQIRVQATNAFYGPKEFADEAVANGLVVARYAAVPVKAGMASRVDTTDALGLSLTVILVPLPPGRFFEGDVALQAISISSYTYSEELERLLMTVVTSIEVAP